eukprot:Selendium_serpulae@DN5545_c0_g2_i1.p1
MAAFLKKTNQALSEMTTQARKVVSPVTALERSPVQNVIADQLEKNGLVGLVDGNAEDDYKRYFGPEEVVYMWKHCSLRASNGSRVYMPGCLFFTDCCLAFHSRFVEARANFGEDTCVQIQWQTVDVVAPGSSGVSVDVTLVDGTLYHFTGLSSKTATIKWITTMKDIIKAFKSLWNDEPGETKGTGNAAEGDVEDEEDDRKIRWKDGRRYEGDLDGRTPHGFGTLTYKNGNQYTGGWNRGKMEGNGVYTTIDGDRYEGSFFGGTKHGEGEEVNAFTGAGFKGTFSRGRKHGFGALTYEDSGSYVGTFEYDHLHGLG